MSQISFSSMFQDSSENYDGNSTKHLFPWLKSDESLQVDLDFYESDESSRRRSACMWLAYAPLWTKVLIVCSTVSLTFSIVFIGVVHIFIRSESILSATRLNMEGLRTDQPSSSPSMSINDDPSHFSLQPSFYPSPTSTRVPSFKPSDSPTEIPLVNPTPSPTLSPTLNPTPSSTLGQKFSLPDLLKFSNSSLSTLHPSFLPSITPLPTFQSSSPSFFPTLPLTLEPTLTPTSLTRDPSSAPSNNDTSLSLSPSAFPSLFSSEAPSYKPSFSSKQFHNSSLSSFSLTSFFVFGDRYKDKDIPEFINEMTSLPSDGEFTVHLGDFNNLINGCEEISYQEMRDLLVNYMPIPTFITPGDNELNDCPDPELAWLYWYQYMGNLDTNWSHKSFSVSRQSESEENFAFYLRSVLYVGLNLVGGAVLDKAVWRKQMRFNLRWIRSQMSEHEEDGVEALVIFGHDDNESRYDNFFGPLSEDVQEYAIPTVYIHESNEPSEVQLNALNTTNLWFLSVEGGSLPFMKVTVDLSLSQPFIFDLP